MNTNFSREEFIQYSVEELAQMLFDNKATWLCGNGGGGGINAKSVSQKEE